MSPGLQKYLTDIVRQMFKIGWSKHGFWYRMFLQDFCYMGSPYFEPESWVKAGRLKPNEVLTHLINLGYIEQEDPNKNLSGSIFQIIPPTFKDVKKFEMDMDISSELF